MTGSEDRAAIPHALFHAVRLRRFGRSTCFLCGRRFGSKTRSDEHVIPKWAQQSYDLWNERLTLLNGTTIPYRHLTIPCCADCNNHHLQPIERAMSKAVAKGPEAVRELDRRVVFLWLGKIFYGLLYKELFLLADRASGHQTPITTPDLLRQYQMHHYFLQSVRVPMEFVDFLPASIFIFETQVPQEPKYQWDFRDSFLNLFISCRMGSVGIISVLQDGGVQQGLAEAFDDFKQFALHPVQFIELAAQVRYKALLFNRTPKYVMVDADPIQVIQLPLQGLSNKPLFDEWDQEQYARVLSVFIGVPLERIFAPPDKVMTWLRNNDGSIKKLDPRKFPWPPPSQ